MNWWEALLTGAGIGLILMPIFVWIAKLFHNTSERRKIKRLIKKGKFLTPLDPRDYDSTGPWKNQITPAMIEENKEQLKRLNTEMFRKPKMPEVSEVSDAQ